MKRLDQQVAIVTGAGRGIGKAVASHYAREGAKVVIAELDTRLGEKLAQELTNTGAQALFIKIDISQVEDIEALTAATKKHFGTIPIKRSSEPEDIADLAVFLASKEARNVTGQSWNVDGGLVCD